MDASVICDHLLRMKYNITLAMFISLNANINLNNGLIKFINWSNLYPQRVMGTLGVKEFTVGIMKSEMKMGQPSGSY